MDKYDLLNALQKKLEALSFAGRTLKPDEVFDASKNGGADSIRRGYAILGADEFAGFGNGRYVRKYGLFQIDIWVLRTSQNALKAVNNLSDAHLAHFYPANGRGQTLTENATSAHILKRPAQTSMGREGVYLREMVEVEFYVEIPAVG